MNEAGLSLLCPGYKAFFHHVDAPMRRMCALLRENRAPSEIVAEYAAADATPPAEPPGAKAD